MEKRFPEERILIPNIGNIKIPWPYTNFGKSLDGILKNGRFNLQKAEFLFDSEYGMLKRIYKKDNDKLKISYSRDIRLYNSNIEELAIKEDAINRQGDEIKMEPEVFYDLYSNENIGGDYIYFNMGNSNTEVHLNRFKGKLFLLGGQVEYNDRNSFLIPNLNKSKEAPENETLIIEELYLNRDEVLKYVSDVVDNLSKRLDGYF